MGYESCLKIDAVSKGNSFMGMLYSKESKISAVTSTFFRMKKFSNFCIVAFLGSIAFLCQAQTTVNVQTQQTTSVPVPTPYAIVSRNANSRVWEQTAYEVSPSGETISHMNYYTELGTGLCYERAVNWSWGGTATNNFGTWSLEIGTNSVAPHDFPTTSFPQWNGNITNTYLNPPVNYN
jgi:hypothetical protein